MAAKKRSGRPQPARQPGAGRPTPSQRGGTPGPGPTTKAPPSGGAAAGKAAPVTTNRVAVATAPLLVRLSTLPRMVLPLTIGVLALTGLALGGVLGLVCLLVVAALLSWMLVLFWPVTPGPGRFLRVAAIVALVAAGIAQAF